jgi:hypothetical protein
MHRVCTETWDWGSSLNGAPAPVFTRFNFLFAWLSFKYTQHPSHISTLCSQHHVPPPLQWWKLFQVLPLHVITRAFIHIAPQAFLKVNGCACSLIQQIAGEQVSGGCRGEGPDGLRDIECLSHGLAPVTIVGTSASLSTTQIFLYSVYLLEGHTCHDPHEEVRRELVRVNCFLLNVSSGTRTQAPQTWWQAHLPTKPSPWPHRAEWQWNLVSTLIFGSTRWLTQTDAWSGLRERGMQNTRLMAPLLHTLLPRLGGDCRGGVVVASVRITASGWLHGKHSLSTAGQLPYELTAVRTAWQVLLLLKPDNIPACTGKVAIKSQPPSWELLAADGTVKESPSPERYALNYPRAATFQRRPNTKHTWYLTV